ncbi:hypothetical protein A0H81_01096 [Grifola frondosa]|uniref:Uncharacterized protein n=1 Tax=Grifola frondosa TaxID=5627 RepID=A0A1C7MQR4_GRIFR|nr:hypothetical protein A0H81_01096 [Grifola frondosa]
MSSSSIRVAVIVLELSSVVLLSLLLATPAPKHPIVNALIVACLLRSLLDVLPPIVFEVIPEKFNGTVTERDLARFCIVDGIIVHYLTVVKAAFSVSFTLPCLCMTIIMLCMGPFVWSLPVVLVPIPALVRSPLHPVFNITACYVRDNAFQIVSLTLTLIPLALAMLVSVSILMILWRYCELPILNHLGSLRSTRIGRFGALVFTIAFSAFLYAAVLAKWIRQHDDWIEGRTSSQVLLTISIVWEAVCPLILFLIFAAQREVYEMWYDWLCCLTRRNSPTQSGANSHSTVAYHHPRRHPSEILHWLWAPCGSLERAHAEEDLFGPRHSTTEMVSEEQAKQRGSGSVDIASAETTFPGRIASLSAKFPPSFHLPPSRPCPPTVPDVVGLNPPPRSVGSRSESPEEALVILYLRAVRVYHAI